MQDYRAGLSPAPDVVRGPSAPPRFSDGHPTAPPPTLEFLVIGLFALRLTKRLIESLDYYPGRDSDIIWLVNFLAPFSDDYSLAKISGSQKDEYLEMYHRILSRMKKQPRYPIRFMQMNPDQSIYQTRRRSDAERPRNMTDGKCTDALHWQYGG
ncbi:hypothetical protein DDE82_008314 [Stemphylium lycopersici]|uniref:Uncharacterized protein n=1 Tax=Stemphylium lycopersici TaxID=183478 RepID=A0A364N8E1_STELY|nr:hypothetical protein TW65_07793 [Stemphylium lycopersici]RAQ99386.1 hypothetical protein DDE82_008314 [Stemphylium lycopersici]RAR13433.1 hypothetical protein DDE83_003164 [Stemphylium lycopersici]